MEVVDFFGAEGDQFEGFGDGGRGGKGAFEGVVAAFPGEAGGGPGEEGAAGVGEGGPELVDKGGVVGAGSDGRRAEEAELFAAAGEPEGEFGEGRGAEVVVLGAAGVADEVEGAVVVELAEDDAAGAGAVVLVDGGERGDARAGAVFEVEGVAEGVEPGGSHGRRMRDEGRRMNRITACGDRRSIGRFLSGRQECPPHRCRRNG